MPRTASTAPYDTSTLRSSSTSVVLLDAEVGVDDTLVGEHGVGTADRDELAELEDRDPVAQRGDEVELVVDEQDRDAVVPEAAQVFRRAARSRPR